MMRGAIVENGVVMNVILAETPADFGAVPCGDGVGIGWLYDGEQFTKPQVQEEEPPNSPEPDPTTLEDMIAAKLAELDDYRWQKEVGGTAFGDGTIRTDWNSQNKIAAAYIMAINDPDYTIPVWEVVPGVFIPLDNATIRALGVTVRDHVQATFNRKAQLHPIIAALDSVEAVAAFDIAAEW